MTTPIKPDDFDRSGAEAASLPSGTRRATDERAQVSKSRAPAWLAGLLPLAALGLGWYLLSGKTSAATQLAPAPSAALPEPPKVIERSNSSIWSVALCRGDCVAGTSCTVARYARPGWCKGASCACPSGLECLPGDGSAVIERDERFTIGFSFVTLNKSDPCVDHPSYWMCLRPTAGGEWQCATQREACDNVASGSPAARVKSFTRVSGVVLTETGLDLSIWSSEPTTSALDRAAAGEVVDGLIASGNQLKYGSVTRVAACRGLSFSLPEPESGRRWTANLLLLPER